MPPLHSIPKPKKISKKDKDKAKRRKRNTGEIVREAGNDVPKRNKKVLTNMDTIIQYMEADNMRRNWQTSNTKTT